MSTITLNIKREVRDALIVAAKARGQTMHQFALSCLLTEAIIAMRDEEKKLAAKKE